MGTRTSLMNSTLQWKRVDTRSSLIVQYLTTEKDGHKILSQYTVFTTEKGGHKIQSQCTVLDNGKRWAQDPVSIYSTYNGKRWAPVPGSVYFTWWSKVQGLIHLTMGKGGHHFQV